MAKSESRNSHAVKNHQATFSQRIYRYFLAHVMAFKISFRNLSVTPFATLLTMAAIGVCISLPVGLYVMIKNAQQFSQNWDEGSALSLYIEPKATTKQIDTLIAKVKAYPFVENTTFISPDSALKEFQDASGLKDTLALLPENPLPGVINVQINTQMTSPDEIQKMKESLEHQAFVKQAVFDYAWVTKLNAALRFCKALTHSLYFIIGLGVMLMVGNTIRLALERHRDEIEVLKLIGATTAFIRRPFLYRGILYGLLGGIIAAVVITQMIGVLEKPALSLENLFQGVFLLENLSFYDTVLLLAMSACLGWLGAGIAFAQQHRLMDRHYAE